MNKEQIIPAPTTTAPLDPPYPSCYIESEIEVAPRKEPQKECSIDAILNEFYTSPKVA